ncbi:hypothetical protein SD80_016725 [Scytonema tolypothrichoides VB-61278]|nr:hypothetical protein SD80_016725 [Scytonema tolypothrichoides VB-61278]
MLTSYQLSVINHQLLDNCSLFTFPCSLFPVPCSLFPVPCSLFPLLIPIYLSKSCGVWSQNQFCVVVVTYP